MGGRQGFASMDPEKHKKIAAQGGIQAHLNKKAHEWSSEEAKEAGRIGGKRIKKKKKYEK